MVLLCVAFMFQKPPLPLYPGRKAGQRTIASDQAVTGHQKKDSVLPCRLAYRLRGHLFDPPVLGNLLRQIFVS